MGYALDSTLRDHIGLPLVVCAAAFGCGGSSSPSGPDAAAGAALDAIQQQFQVSCAGGGCHIDFNSAPAADLDLSRSALCANLLDVAALEAPTQLRLVAGDPDASYLLCKLDPDCPNLPAGAQLMPVGQAPLSADERDSIRTWISDGAPGCTSAADDTEPPSFTGATQALGGSQQVRVSWAPASDNVSVAADIEYLVYQAETSGAQVFTDQPAQITAPGASEAVISALALDTEYFFVVRARDQAGNVDENTAEVSATTLATADDQAPNFAGATSATPRGATNIDISWDAASDDVTAPENITYQIYVSDAASGQDFTNPSQSVTAATTTTVTDLDRDTSYFVVVRARDEAGNEDQNTQEVSATTGAAISFTQDIEPILVTRCTDSACHDAANPVANLALTQGVAFDSLVGVDADQCRGQQAGRVRVEPGDPGSSYLIDKLKGTNMCSGTAMPKASERLSPATIAIFEDWIQAGASAAR